jgi:hypothetical protein
METQHIPSINTHTHTHTHTHTISNANNAEKIPEKTGKKVEEAHIHIHTHVHTRSCTLEHCRVDRQFVTRPAILL